MHFSVMWFYFIMSNYWESSRGRTGSRGEKYVFMLSRQLQKLICHNYCIILSKAQQQRTMTQDLFTSRCSLFYTVLVSTAKFDSFASIEDYSSFAQMGWNTKIHYPYFIVYLYKAVGHAVSCKFLRLNRLHIFCVKIICICKSHVELDSRAGEFGQATFAPKITLILQMIMIDCTRNNAPHKTWMRHGKVVELPSMPPTACQVQRNSCGLFLTTQVWGTSRHLVSLWKLMYLIRAQTDRNPI